MYSIVKKNSVIIHISTALGRVLVWYTVDMYTTTHSRRVETRTYADRKAYLKKAVSERRRKLREMALEYGGGKCQKCGYKRCARALSFHHKDPTEKDFGLSARGLTRSWEKIKKELDKCILLCANCHMETHENGL